MGLKTLPEARRLAHTGGTTDNKRLSAHAGCYRPPLGGRGAGWYCAQREGVLVEQLAGTKVVRPTGRVSTVPSEQGSSKPTDQGPPQPTPAELVEALQNREESARRQLGDWLRAPVRRLMEELSRRHNLPHNLDRLTRHALHALEAYLRTRRPRDFEGMSVDAFRGALLLQIAKQVVQPYGGQRTLVLNGTHGLIHIPDPLPDHDIYQAETVFLPYEKIGSFWFGGDWYGGHRTPDGALWVIVADITGHGYYAYLLANALPGVWQMCWSNLQTGQPEPAEVLAAMHDLLHECLPEGVFVECTLLRFDLEGKVTVSPAGGSRLLWRRKEENRLNLVKLRGLWLGLDRPTVQDQHTCILEHGDELLIGTDGVFDQLLEHHGGTSDLAAVLGDFLARRTLHEAVSEAIQVTLRHGPQKDDITAVVVHRRVPEG